jgi:pyruvate/2-oxoglutarate dehydrogenase complex dihydrolipoamide dehydrogenase (E3) component
MTVATVAGDPHDARLLTNVHPPDWANPEPAAKYNLVVIGAGTAGLVAAAGAAGLGAKVALVERDLLGGDCLNAGCVPSKALLRSARAAAAVRDAHQFGVRVPDGWRVDFPAVMARMRAIRADLSPHDSAARFRDLGVDVFLGQAAFAARDAVAVGGKTLRFARAVIATGSRAHHPHIPGLDGAGFLTNENVFALAELPRRLAIVGAGSTGCELAQAFARFGSRITLISHPAQLLPTEDADATELIAKSLARDGVDLLLGCEVTRVELRGAEKLLFVKAADAVREVAVDAILVATGRVPNVDALNLEAGGVESDREGVKVDDRLRTTNSRVFAAGDVCSRFKFTHAADAMARLVLRNALFRGRARVSRLVIPWCTYTDPELAHVGLSERDARERNIPHRVFVQEMGRVDRAVLDGEPAGFVKVVAHPKRDTILGATVVAAHAGEMIAEVALAMTAKLGLKTLADTVHPYPTQAEAVKKVGDAFNSTRLTPTVKWLFAKWLAWSRR